MLVRITGRPLQAEAEALQAALSTLRLALKSPHGAPPSLMVIDIVYHHQAPRLLAAVRCLVAQLCGIAQQLAPSQLVASCLLLAAS